jgi:hypothetical protein
MKAYPVPSKRRRWRTQIEFLDGTVIDAMSDGDAVDRWARLAGWSDPKALDDRAAWMESILTRARVFYGARLIGINAYTPTTLILDALAAEQCLLLRRL